MLRIYRPSSDPVPMPVNLVRLCVELNDLLSADASLMLACRDACAVADSLRAEWKATPKRERMAKMEKRRDEADAEVQRLGGLAIDLDAKIDAIRAEIARLEG